MAGVFVLSETRYILILFHFYPLKTDNKYDDTVKTDVNLNKVEFTKFKPKSITINLIYMKQTKSYRFLSPGIHILHLFHNSEEKKSKIKYIL